MKSNRHNMGTLECTDVEHFLSIQQFFPIWKVRTCITALPLNHNFCFAVWWGWSTNPSLFIKTSCLVTAHQKRSNKIYGTTGLNKWTWVTIKKEKHNQRFCWWNTINNKHIKINYDLWIFWSQGVALILFDIDVIKSSTLLKTSILFNSKVWLKHETYFPQWRSLVMQIRRPSYSQHA